MKNHQYIRQLKMRKLAELLVKEIDVNEGDEGCDGEMHDFYVTRYITPDGAYSYDLDDAVSHTIDWLNSERKSERP